MMEVNTPREIIPLSSSKATPVNPYKALHLQEEKAPHHSTRSRSRSRSKTRKSSSRKKKRKDSASNKKKSSALSDSNDAAFLDDEQKRRHVSSSQKMSIRYESCKALHPQEEEAPHRSSRSRRKTRKSSSRKKKRKDSASNNNKTSTLSGSSDAAFLDDEQKRRDASSSQKISIRNESWCRTMRGSGEYSYLSSPSAISRMSAASAVNRGEMISIIESMRRDRDVEISGRERCIKNHEVPLHQFEEQRKALLIKWQTMSEQRKLSRQSSSMEA
jgi:hypothetical protein